MTMGVGAAVCVDGGGGASDSLGWTCTTGTEREVVVGLEGVPEERERLGQREKLPKKRFLEKREPAQTLPIGPPGRGGDGGQSLLVLVSFLFLHGGRRMALRAAAERGTFRREAIAGGRIGWWWSWVVGGEAGGKIVRSEMRS
jgi:hypothetical protein